MIDVTLPPTLKAFADREFVGEALLWAERPNGSTNFFKAFGIWIFAIPWTTFALFWESMVAGPLILPWFDYEIKGAPPGDSALIMLWVMALFGLPFIFIGLGMLLSPFYVLRKNYQTFYVLTSRRLAILTGTKNITITSIKPGEIRKITRKERPDGRGSLAVSLGHMRDNDGDRVEKIETLGTINDVRRVEHLINGLAIKNPN
jgi:hypothetical protein